MSKDLAYLAVLRYPVKRTVHLIAWQDSVVDVS